MSDSENATLALLFSPATIETVALLHFDISEAAIGTLKAEEREDEEGFKRNLLRIYKNKGHSRKVTSTHKIFSNHLIFIIIIIIDK